MVRLPKAVQDPTHPPPTRRLSRLAGTGTDSRTSIQLYNYQHHPRLTREQSAQTIVDSVP